MGASGPDRDGASLGECPCRLHRYLCRVGEPDSVECGNEVGCWEIDPVQCPGSGGCGQQVFYKTMEGLAGRVDWYRMREILDINSIIVNGIYRYLLWPRGECRFRMEGVF